MLKRFMVVLMLVLVSGVAHGMDSTPDPFEGYWKTKDGNFILRIEKNSTDTYNGRVVWLRNPNFPEGDRDEGKVQTDRNNPDPDLRNRGVLGLQIVGDLKLDDRKLRGGWVYDSWNGKKYYGSARVNNENLLKLRGSLDKFGVLGYTMKAYRVPSEEYSRYGLN